MEKRQIENIQCLVLDINGNSIFLDEQADIIALVQYAGKFIDTPKKTNLVR